MVHAMNNILLYFSLVTLISVVGAYRLLLWPVRHQSRQQPLLLSARMPLRLHASIPALPQSTANDGPHKAIELSGVLMCEYCGPNPDWKSPCSSNRIMSAAAPVAPVAPGMQNRLVLCDAECIDRLYFIIVPDYRACIVIHSLISSS
jgi:hypothetical protein